MNLKKYSLVFASIMFITSNHSVLALELGSIRPATNIRQQLNEKVKEIRVQNVASREAQKIDLIDQRKTRVDSAYKAIRNQLTQKFELFTKIKAQIQTRISNKEAKGVDMTTAKANLANFEKHQTAYLADLAAFDAKYNEFADNSDKHSVFVANLKIAATKVKLDLNSMRQSLISTLKIIVSTNK